MPYGNEAFNTIMGYSMPITQAAQKIFKKDGRIIIPSVHPSYVARGIPEKDRVKLFEEPLLRVKVQLELTK
jgi:uracil-DNA glycosylase